MTLRYVPTTRLLRLAGLAALVGGSILVLARGVRLLDLTFPNLFEGSGATVLAALSVAPGLRGAGELLVGLGLIGLYVRQARGAGITGFVGFVLALLGTELIRANYLAVMFADLGLALFGVASLRAQVYPRAAAVLLIVSALVSEIFNPTVRVALGENVPGVGAVAGMVLFGTLAWMGLLLFRERHEVVEEEVQTFPRPFSSTGPNLLWLGGLATVVGAALVVLFGLSELVNLFRPDPGASTSGFDQAEVVIMYVQQNLALVGGALVGLGLVALYVDQAQEEEPTDHQPPGVRVLALIGFLLAFCGSFFALDIEDVNWAAVLATNVGWILFGAACYLRAPRAPRLYPRPALVLLIATALIGGVFLNPIVVTLVVGESWASSLLYVGQGAYPLAYASTGLEIVFNLAVAWLGLALLRRRRAGTTSARRRLPWGGGSTDQTSGRASFTTRPSTRVLLTAAVAILGLIPIALVTGIFPGGQPPELDVAQSEQSTETNPSCPSADQATYGAYHSSRLVLHNPCQRLVGTIYNVEGGESDGDLDIFVNLDPDYASLSGAPQNTANVRRFGYGGNFLMELMPRDAPHIPAPKVGDMVDVYGAYVFDTGHGYFEIHPIFSMTTSSDGGQSWGETYTSGPQYCGPPRRASNAQAFTQCRDENGNHCKGYYDPNKP